MIKSRPRYPVAKLHEGPRLRGGLYRKIDFRLILVAANSMQRRDKRDELPAPVRTFSFDLRWYVDWPLALVLVVVAREPALLPTYVESEAIFARR